jgi:flagellar hook-associated protein 2
VSSPITLSNFNNIDFSVILNAVMQQASQPLTTLQSQRDDITSEGSAYSSLASKLGSLETAAAGLSTSTAVTAYATSVSDSSAVSVVSTGTSVPGTYDVVVNNLAKAQVTASSSTSPDADTTAVATGGTLTIGGVDVNITGSVTLKGLADQINGTAGIGVTAAVVQSSPAHFQLVLTSAQTGSAGSFTVANNLTGGGANSVGFSGTNTQNALNASLTINNLPVTSSSNTLTSAIPGATLTLLHADPTKTVTASISADDSAVVDSVKTFVSAYNDVLAFINDQSTQASNGTTGTIAHEALVSQARSTLRSVLSGTYGSGTFTHLAEVGIGFNQSGQLTLTPATLSAALAQDRGGVLSLFTGNATTTSGFTNGAFGAVQAALDDFTKAGGFVSSAQSLLTAQGARLDNQIADMQARLAVQRTTLQQQYTAADEAMSQLKSQSGSLSSSSSNLVTN